MFVTVKTLQQKSFQVDIDQKEKISSLKEKIFKEAGHPVASQKLIFSGKILVDEQTVEECKITEKDFVVVMVSKSKAPAATPAATPAGSSAPAPTATTPSAEQTQPQPAAAPVTPTTTTATDSATSVSFSSGLLTGAELESAVKNMTEMGFPREQVMRAMRASFNNPDRAVEYLMNGIPEHLNATEQAPGQTAGAQPAAAPGTQPSSTPAAPGGPINLFEAAAQAAQRSQQAGGGGGGGHGDLAGLANQPQFQQLRSLVQSNPALLEPLLQQIGQANPQLLELINQNQEAFMRMLEEGGEMDEGGEAAPPGSQYVHVTQEERDAIERLVGLGFERGTAIEAFFACDKNEELAANYLLNMGHEDDETWG